MATGGIGAGEYGDDATGCKIDTITVDAYGRVTAVACGTTGDIQGVTAGTLLSGGATSGTATLGIDSGALDYLNQSACPGLCCQGTTTPSNTQTFTNKSGNISQWSNDSGYLTEACSGTVTSVTRGNGIDGTGSITTTGTIAVGAGTGITVASESVSLAAACRNALASAYTTTSNLSGCAGLDCTGTTTHNNTQTFTNKGGSNNQWTNDAGYTTCTGTLVPSDISGLTTCTGTTTPSNTQTFTNKSGSNSQWTNDEGYTCNVGDITGITAGAGLSGGGTSGTPTIAVDGVLVATLNQSGCAGLDCTGTTTASNSQTFTNKCGNISQWTNNSNFTTCTGTLNPSGTIATNDYAKYDSSGCLVGRDCSQVRSDLGIGSAASCTAASLDQSACAGILCTGTTTAANTQTFTNKSGNISQWSNDAGYLTAACEGTVTGIDAGTAITITDGGTATPTVGVTGACNTAWNAKTTCTGTLNPSGTIATNDYAKYNSSGCLVGRSCSEVRSDLGIGTAASCTAASLDQSACAGLNCVGDITGVSVTNGIAGGGTTGSVSLCVDSTVVRTTGNQVIGGTKHFSSTVIVPSLSATGTVQANCFAAGAYMEANAPAVEVYPQGTVLALNSGGCVVESTEEESSMVFGVAAGDDKAPIVMGAEPICITGCITAGDFITTSSCKGHGKKSTNPSPFGTIIGQAMESGGGDSYEIKAMIRKM